MKKLRTVPAYKTVADGLCSMCEQPVLTDPGFQYCDDECRMVAFRYYFDLKDKREDNHNNDWVPNGIPDDI
jgi:hypothetical protein